MELRRDALRLGNLSAAQKGFWIQRHYKTQGLTHLIPVYSDPEGSGLERWIVGGRVTGQ